LGNPIEQGALTMNPITAFLAVVCVAIGVALGAFGYVYWDGGLVVVAIVIAFALRMANTWEKFVILRSGPLLIIPIVDNVVAVIDERI
jgi:hypothetical protein